MLPVLGLVLLAGAARADETPVRSKIVAVSLFKNGLAVVRREVTLGQAGAYVLDDVPNPVHGTFWVESTAPVETVVQTREVEVPADAIVPGTLQEDLAGKKVTIHFKGEKLPPITGKMLAFKPGKEAETFARENPAGVMPQLRFLVVQTAKGRCYLEPSEVAFVQAEGAGENVKRRKSRMVLTVRDNDRAETRVAISYLTHGLGWAPSYKIDITDPKTLTVEQQALVKNELADFDGAEVQLISGFPSVQFANVTSPLAARTNWATFFQELNQRSRRDPDVFSNSAVIQQQAIYNNPVAPVFPGMTATPAGEGVDLHYQSIGKRTLAEGDCLSLTVAKGKSSYERIVEWLVPDSRDEWGRNVEGRSRGEEDDSAWDALKFKNPLSFPMTTGPAMVTAGGKFNGQRTSYWANTGEETVLRVNKALSIRTNSLEHEERKHADDLRELVWIGGHQFRKATVEGELAIGNHRAEEVRLVIRRRFSGELLEAEGKPTASLREEGVYSVNRRNELLWNLTLKAGEERKLKYHYTLLVAN
jgi:hypothetical protein